MIQRTKEELIEEIKSLKVTSDTTQAQAFNTGVTAAAMVLQKAEIVEEPIYKELEEAKKKFPVGSYFKVEGHGNTLFQVALVRFEEKAVNFGIMNSASAILYKIEMPKVFQVITDLDEVFNLKYCSPFTFTEAAKPIGKSCKDEPPTTSADYIVSDLFSTIVAYYDTIEKTWNIPVRCRIGKLHTTLPPQAVWYETTDYKGMK